MYKKSLTKEQALQKLKHYCAYQERAHSEVKEKLYDLGVWKKDHDEIISTLIEENYLNEERFAIAFAGGKWRVKHWGRVKIKYELKQKQVSEYCIKKAMKQIDEDIDTQLFDVLASALPTTQAYMRSGVQDKHRVGEKFSALCLALEAEADFLRQNKNHHSKIYFLEDTNRHTALVPGHRNHESFQ